MRSVHWHPLLLALYPSLHLLAHNIASVRPRAAFPSLAVAAAGVAVLWLVFGAALRNRGKGALLSALAAVLFFSHGYLLKAVGESESAPWILIIGGGVLLVAAGILLAVWKGDPRPWNRVLDVISLVLVVIVLVPIAGSELRPATNLPAGEEQAEVQAPLGYLPDIYVIILDGFGRADQLNQIYDVDLSALQSHLEQRNFAIAAEARANYCQTSMSLATLFNSDYLPGLLEGFKEGYKDVGALNRLVREGRNVRLLREMGYQLVTVAGGSELAAQANPDVNFKGGALNEFQATVLANTPVPFILSRFDRKKSGRWNPFDNHRKMTRYQFGKLPFATADGGPRFVFAHIMAPHPPFVLDAEGGELQPDYGFTHRERAAWDGYVEKYAGQATWVAREIQKTVDGILGASRRPPVILIMGDHGPASKWVASWRKKGNFHTSDPDVVAERISIFLALHLPPGKGGEVYPELTPVNIFPLVFERCFGETAALKEDRSFFSTYEEWSVLWDVNRVLGKPRK
ncbi:MAG: hypothetical protein ABFS42_03305 [Candidatus Krumholzibacteriota bacterium]